MTATPESPTAKRLKVSGRTLKIDSSDSSGIDGAHAGSAEDEDNPSATAAAQVRSRLPFDAMISLMSCHSGGRPAAIGKTFN